MNDLLPPSSRVFVAGHRGLVGSAVARRLQAQGYQVLTRTRAELDLRDCAATEAVRNGARSPTRVAAELTDALLGEHASTRR